MSFFFCRDLTLRGAILAVFGSALMAASSCYVALRIGALPWPTVFAALLSLACLRPFGASLREVNTTGTGISAGGLVAGGLAFTLPGLWMVDAAFDLPMSRAVGSVVGGVLLGIVATAAVRRFFIDEMKLPFPMGVAAAETLRAGDRGGAGGRILFGSCAFSAVVTVLRDQLALIPPALMLGPTVGFWLSPMAVGIGYIIGPLYIGAWFAGMALAHGLLVPLGHSFGFFADANAATAFRNSLGVGMILGSGLAVVAQSMLSGAKALRVGDRKGAPAAAVKSLRLRSAVVGLLGLACASLVLVGKLPLTLALPTLALALCFVVMAAAMTGQTGIDPMEIFAILALFLIGRFVTLGPEEAFLIAAAVAVAAGLAGDALQDFKTGSILGTEVRSQIGSELIGGLVGAVVGTVTLFALVRAYGVPGPGTDLPAPQAFAVKSLLSGIAHTPAFLVGVGAGIVATVAGFPGMPVGIGIYLPPVITITVSIGGVLRYVVLRMYQSRENGMIIVASGFLGGEGVAGVLVALFRLATMS